MDKRDILVFGGKGFIGSHFKQCLQDEHHIYYIKEILNGIDKYKPKVIINAIGATGEGNTDDCEDDIDGTLKSNSLLPLCFAEAAIRRNIKLVHISSGCLYQTRAYKINETEAPDFFDLFYSRSKIYAEVALESLSRSNKANILIVRPRIPFSGEVTKKNLFTKLMKFDKVIDFPNSLTSLEDFAKAVYHLIDRDCRGIYNVVNDPPLSYVQIMDHLKPGEDIKTMPLSELKTPRTNIGLSIEKLASTGFKMRDSFEAAVEAVKKFREGISGNRRG